MCGEGIPGKEDVDISSPDDPCERPSGTRMDDGRTADESNFSSLFLDFDDLPGYPSDDGLTRSLWRDGPMHELERGDFAGPLWWAYADSILTYDHEISLFQLRDGCTERLFFHWSITTRQSISMCCTGIHSPAYFTEVG